MKSEVLTNVVRGLWPSRWHGALEDVERTLDELKAEGYRIIEPEPESFKRIIGGREAVRIRREL